MLATLGGVIGWSLVAIIALVALAIVVMAAKGESDDGSDYEY